MDTLIATSTLLAWGASTLETMRGGAHVWFDAAVMFVFLLLVARLLEQRARQQSPRRTWTRWRWRARCWPRAKPRLEPSRQCRWDDWLQATSRVSRPETPCLQTACCWMRRLPLMNRC